MPKFQPIPSFDSLSPQTTKGDLISRTTTGAVRVAIGSDGTVPIADSSQAAGLRWGSPTAGSLSVVAKTSAYGITSSDDIITVSGGVFNTTLPDVTVSANRKLYRVVKTDTSLVNIVTIDTTSSQNIEYNGTTQTSVTLNTVDEEWEIGPNSAGTAWRVLNHKTATAPVTSTINISATSAYTFTIPSSAIVAGDVYVTPNGSLFTVTTSGTLTTLTAAGNGAPNAANSTLTRVSGTGAAGPITYTATTSTGQPAIAGGATKNIASWIRQANLAIITLTLEQVLGTIGSGDYVIFWPTGLVASSTIVPSNVAPGTYVSNAAGGAASVVTSSSASFYQGANYSIKQDICAYSSRSFRYAGISQGNTGFNWSPSNFPLNSASTMFFSVTISVPIQGWFA